MAIGYKAMLKPEQLPPFVASLPLILFQTIERLLFPNYLLQKCCQLVRFNQSNVHALNADRSGLMGGIAKQPAAALAELPCQPMFEGDLLAPKDFIDLAREPWC